MKLLKDLLLLVRCYPIAKGRVWAHSETKYPGAVRHMIAYNETRTELVTRGVCVEAEITGAVVMIAVGLAYLMNR
jgi:hypothetical protein